MNRFTLALSTLLASLRTRGLRKTIRLAVDEFRFDRQLGLDTSGFLDTTSMDIVDGKLDAAQPYMPTARITFNEICKQLDPVLRLGTFIDYGSGKGRVLVLATLSGFNKVVGIEFERTLCDTARRNLVTLKRAGITVPVEIINQDAAAFPIPVEASTFYFYNPFDEQVMSAVLERIQQSLHFKPRPHIIIYMNPTCHEVFIKAGFHLQYRGDSSVGQTFHLYNI